MMRSRLMLWLALLGVVLAWVMTPEEGGDSSAVSAPRERVVGVARQPVAEGVNDATIAPTRSDVTEKSKVVDVFAATS